ncbi:MAG: IS200/IS605 family transposase [Methanocella sp.]
MELNSFCHGYGQITYHLVFVPKYRRKIFYGSVKGDCELVIRDICDRCGYKMTSLHVAADHVHLFVEFHPTVPLSSVVKQLKGESAVRLTDNHYPYQLMIIPKQVLA